MAFVDWTSPRNGKARYTSASFTLAKAWFFDKWCELAAQSGRCAPADLSGSCKYGSIFMQAVFGGSIRGHFEHQYNYIDGRLVDLSHDALDVGRMSNPYLHELDFFSVPELQASLSGCQNRAELWAAEFLLSLEPACPSELPIAGARLEDE